MPTYPPTTDPISPSNPVTASLVSAIPVPTYGPGGFFSILAKTHIAAPPALVLNTVRNTNEWNKWNSFCPRCVLDMENSSPSGDEMTGGRGEGNESAEEGKEGWLDVGTTAYIEVFMNGDGLVPDKKKSRDQGIVVTILKTLDELEDGKVGYRIAWQSTGFSSWLLHSERVMDFVELDGGAGTEYTCWETFGGLLGSVVRATVGGQLVERFGDYARDVKEFVEAGKRGEGV